MIRVAGSPWAHSDDVNAQRNAAPRLEEPFLRALVPPTMNVSVRLAEDPAFRLDT
jgi:hypothetical protein